VSWDPPAGIRTATLEVAKCYPHQDARRNPQQHERDKTVELVTAEQIAGMLRIPPVEWIRWATTDGLGLGAPPVQYVILRDEVERRWTRDEITVLVGAMVETGARIIRGKLWVLGHQILGQGAPHAPNGVRVGVQGRGYGCGRCECGATSGLLHTHSERLEWHRAHVRDLLAKHRPNCQPR
jgi:hypothetical protein